MVSLRGPTCARCKRRNVVTFSVDPPTAYATVVLNRWRNICPSCFDEEAERGGIAYRFTDVKAASWSERPAPRNVGRQLR